MGHIEDIYSKIANDASLSEAERQELAVLLDPVAWAEVTLKNPENQNEFIYCREYQRKALRCQPYSMVTEDNRTILTNRIKVYRMGRRTGKSVMLAVEALWKAATTNNYRIIYIAPFESQCEIFFNMIERLMSGTVIQTKRFVRKPYIIQFNNGSIIRAHTANVRSSRKGSSIRGAEADLAILDEMDHGIDEVINEVIMPIYMGNNQSTMIGASTPCGRRGLFYTWCMDKVNLGIEEFHYPSMVSPRWTPEAERLAKITMTKEQYVHEILAEFGEELEGVFRHIDLDVVMQNYKLDVLKHNPNNLYIMGVDWNEKFGGRVVIVERSKKTGLYRLFKSYTIEKQEFTQLESINKIINVHLNECPCDYIYVDKGYGATQIELLKRYGITNPSSKFQEIIKDIDYGGNILVRDPISGMELPKPAKAFLVTNTQLIVEQHKIFIPEDEDTEYGLIGQMRNFRVAKLSSVGHPVYDGKLRGEDNDHTLNALMLALIGFSLEFTDMVDYEATSKINSVATFHIPVVKSRISEIPSDEVSKFKQLIGQTLPNFRNIIDRPRNNKKEQEKTVGFVRNFKSSKPTRSTF